ncbi:MAG: 30S ribosome-binding factor RbfA [Mycoplasmoidaceae bacterium]
MKNIKTQKYESQITKELNQFIHQEIYNKTLKFAKITYVKLSNDYSSIKAYVDCMQRDKLDILIKKLNESHKLFRNQIAQNFSFKYCPNIIFIRDETIDRVEEIEIIFNQIHNKENRND